MTPRGTPGRPALFIGVSIPRSGHHFLESILTAYWGEELRYCAFYGEPGCCRQVPCTRRRGERVIYQKNHDWGSAVPIRLDGVSYLVQYRHPVPAALSDWERSQRARLDPRGAGWCRSRAAHAWYLASKAAYFRRFHDKWLAAAVPGAILIEYERLRADPATTLAPVFSLADGSVDAARLDRALAATTGIRASSGEPYRPRVVALASLPFPDLMIAFEAHVIENCPRFGYARHFAGEGAREEFLGVLTAIDETLPLPEGETDRLAAADRLSAGHPEVRLRLIERHLREGKATEALDLAEALTAGHPGFAPGWGALLRAARRLNAPPRLDAFGGEAIFGAAGNPEVLEMLGQALLAAGETVKAATVLAIGAGLHPDRSRLRAVWAQALTRLGRHEAAAAELQEAVRRDPNDRLVLRIKRGLVTRHNKRAAEAASG